MSVVQPSPRTRVASALLAVAIPAGLIAVLIRGLAVPLPQLVDDGLALFSVSPPPPPPPPHRIVPEPVRNTRPEGEAAPPNLRSRATEVVAPEPLVVTPLPPPPVIVAPVADAGREATSGAAEVPGPGTGAGGIGQGRGSGGAGDGTGGHGADETPPVQIGGRLSVSDLPDTIAAGGTVEVSYVVGTDGGVSDCRIERSSGNRVLDVLTCRQIERRFRFRPSRDGRGHPVRSVVVENHSWDIEHEIAPPPPRRRRGLF